MTTTNYFDVTGPEVKVPVAIFLELEGVGGVQRVGRHAAAVLTAAEPDCVVLSLRDERGVSELMVGDHRFKYRGFHGSKSQLLLASTALAPRTGLLYLGHPRLATLRWVFAPFGACVWVATYGIDVWRPLPMFARAGLQRAHGVTAVSRATSVGGATNQELDPARVHIVPPALEPGFGGVGQASKSVSDLPAAPRLLTVARLDHGKGIDHVIRAMPRVLSSKPDVSYVVVGEGPEGSRLEHLARQCGVADNVIFEGKVSEQDLGSYYEACEIFVMPSLDEGFGLAFAEAMAYGRPVVAARSGGAVEVVVEGETGLVVDYGNANQLAEAIISLLRSDELRLRLGQAGQQRATTMYTFDRFAETLLETLGLPQEPVRPS